jgi:hypothetical protein
VIVLGCDGRRARELVGLVVDDHRDLLELVAVLSGVVCAEQELAPGGELDTKVSLGTATVASVFCGQGCAGGNSSIHVVPLSSVGA